MTDVNPYAPGSPEAVEWQAIHDRHAAAVPVAPVAASGGIAAPLLSIDPAGLAASGVLFGPDVSQYQGLPAWGTVRASGCTLKAWKETEGRTFLDPSAVHNRAPVAGMIEFCYHFLYYSDEYAAKPSLWAAQADWFAQHARPDVGHVLDVEAAATAGHWLGVREWVAEYRRLFPGHPLGVYSNLALWQNRSRMPYDPAGLFDYVWHAGVGNGYYTTAPGTIAQQWAGTSKLTNSFAGHGYPDCRLWQITDHAQVPGVGGTFCDGNAWQGTAAELTALLTKGTDDTMSQQDVDALKTYLGSDAFIGKIVSGVLGANLGSSGPTVGVALQSGYGFAKQAAANTDTLEASAAGITDALNDQSKAALVEAVSTSTVNRLVAGVHVDATDPAQLKSVLGEALDEHLASLRIVTDQPPA